MILNIRNKGILFNLEENNINLITKDLKAFQKHCN